MKRLRVTSGGVSSGYRRNHGKSCQSSCASAVRPCCQSAVACSFTRWVSLAVRSRASSLAPLLSTNPDSANAIGDCSAGRLAVPDS
ncbi:hypothetical protein D3C78_1783390 [compost metagenome]